MKIIYLLLLIIIACYANFATNSFTFEPFYALYPDTVNFYFLHSINDPSLFPNDLLAIKFMDSFKGISRELIIAKIFQIFMCFFSLSITIKILSIACCVFSTILMYRLGVYLYSRNYAYLFSGMFLLYFLTMDSFYGAQSRCFGAVIFCIFLFCFIKNNFFWIPFLLPMTILFYPYSFVTFLGICIASILFFKKYIKIKKYIVLLTMNIMLSLFFIFLGSRNLIETAFVNLQIFGEYKHSVRWDNVSINLYNPFHVLKYFILNMNEHSRLYIYFTNFFIAMGLVIVALKRRMSLYLPKHIWIMLGVSIISFFLIYPIHPISASRQVVFSIPLFVIFFISINIYRMIKNKVNPAVLLMPATIIFILLHPMFNDIVDYKKKYKPLYDYITTLPKDVLLAGYPKSVIVGGYPNNQLIESIPFFAQRTIFFSDRLRDISLFAYEQEDLRERRKEVIEALYADSLDKVRSFISKYNIDYFVIESHTYEKPFIEALAKADRETYNLISAKSYDSGFLLLQFAKKYYDFRLEQGNSDIFIINTKKIM